MTMTTMNILTMTKTMTKDRGPFKNPAVTTATAKTTKMMTVTISVVGQV
jgi:hypothetical protein